MSTNMLQLCRREARFTMSPDKTIYPPLIARVTPDGDYLVIRMPPPVPSKPSYSIVFDCTTVLGLRPGKEFLAMETKDICGEC